MMNSRHIILFCVLSTLAFGLTTGCGKSKGRNTRVRVAADGGGAEADPSQSAGDQGEPSAPEEPAARREEAPAGDISDGSVDLSQALLLEDADRSRSTFTYSLMPNTDGIQEIELLAVIDGGTSSEATAFRGLVAESLVSTANHLIEAEKPFRVGFIFAQHVSPPELEPNGDAIFSWHPSDDTDDETLDLQLDRMKRQIEANDARSGTETLQGRLFFYAIHQLFTQRVSAMREKGFFDGDGALAMILGARYDDVCAEAVDEDVSGEIAEFSDDCAAISEADEILAAINPIFPASRRAFALVTDGNIEGDTVRYDSLVDLAGESASGPHLGSYSIESEPEARTTGQGLEGLIRRRFTISEADLTLPRRFRLNTADYADRRITAIRVSVSSETLTGRVECTALEGIQFTGNGSCSATNFNPANCMIVLPDSIPDSQIEGRVLKIEIETEEAAREPDIVEA